jgi:hypothetical protein
MKTLFNGKGKFLLTVLVLLCTVVLGCVIFVCINLCTEKNKISAEENNKIETTKLNIKTTATGPDFNFPTSVTVGESYYYTSEINTTFKIKGISSSDYEITGGGYNGMHGSSTGATLKFAYFKITGTYQQSFMVVGTKDGVSKTQVVTVNGYSPAPAEEINLHCPSTITTGVEFQVEISKDASFSFSGLISSDYNITYYANNGPHGSSELATMCYYKVTVNKAGNGHITLIAVSSKAKTKTQNIFVKGDINVQVGLSIYGANISDIAVGDNLAAIVDTTSNGCNCAVSYVGVESSGTGAVSIGSFTQSSSFGNNYYLGITTTKAGTFSFCIKIRISAHSTTIVKTKTITFTIKKGNQTPTISGNSQVTYGSTLQLTGSGQGTMSWSVATASGGGTATISSSGLLTATHVGTVKVTLTAAGNTNYNSGTATKTITIIKANPTLTVTGVKTTYTYTGSLQTVNSGATVNNTEQTIKYSNNTFTTVAQGNGKVVTISVAASTNYNAASKTVTLTVNKASYNMSGVRWNYTSAFTYDGSAKTITLTGLPSGVTPNYSNNSKTNAGTYSASVTFSYDTANYIAPSAVSNCVWVINKATPVTAASVASGTYYIGNKLSTVGISGNSNVAGTFGWNAPETELTKTSESFGWTFSPADTANYNSVTGSLTVVAEYALDRIVVTNAKTEYKAYEAFTTDGMVVTAYGGGSAEAVTDYIITLPYADSGRGHFLVSDDGCKVIVTFTRGPVTKTAEILISVIKADYDFSNAVFGDVTVAYDGQPHSITVGGVLPTGVNLSGYTYNGDSVTEVTAAGSYTVLATFTIDDTDNYNVPVLRAVLTIKKATPSIDVSGVNTQYVYTGALQTVSGGALVDNAEQTVLYKENTFTTVAEGHGKQIIVYVEESDNYEALSVYVEITVEKASLDLTWSGGNGKYDGSAHNAVLTASGMAQSDAQAFDSGLFNSLITVSYTTQDGNAERTKAGTYAPALDAMPSGEPYANYNVTIVNPGYTFTIEKAEAVTGISFNDKTVVYDGKTHTLTVDGALGEDLTVTYYISGGNDLFTGAVDVKRDGTAVAGYSVTAVFESVSGNFEVPNAMTATLTVTPFTITDGDVTGIAKEYEYTGEAQSPAPVAAVVLWGTERTLLVKDSDYEVEYSTEVPDAGTVVTVKVKGTGNYQGEVSIDFTITKKLIGVSWIGTDSYTYNAFAQGKTAEFTGLAAKDVGIVMPTFSYSGAGYPENAAKPVNAGSYKVTVTLDEAFSNYKLAYDKVESTFTINKAKVTLETEYVDYDPATDKLYPDGKLPQLAVKGDATSGSLKVSGSVFWVKVDGKEPWLKLNTHLYAWQFVPDDITNFEIFRGEKELTAVVALLQSMTAEWKDGVQPEIFTSTTLDKIRDFVIVTGILENGDNYVVSNYNLTGSWGSADAPPAAGIFDLEFSNNNGVGGAVLRAYLRGVNYTAVALNRLIYTPVDGASFDYDAFALFDKTTVTVTAIYNDGTEEEVIDYTVAYIAGHEFLWAGDTHVTLKYGSGENEKSCQITVTVGKIDYDLSSLQFDDVKTDYDGTPKKAELASPFADGTVEYVYRIWDEETQSFVTLAGVTGVTNAGRYQVVATFTLTGEANLANYPHDADGVLPQTLTAEIVIGKIDYAGVSKIEFFDASADYNYGNSVLDGLSVVKNVPAGVTVKYSYYDSNGEEADPDAIVNAGEYSIKISFTSDANHNPIKDHTVKFTVNKIDPSVTPKISGSFTQGTHLYQLTCELTDSDTAGRIVWDDDEQTLVKGMYRYYYTFVPEDSQNFNTVKLYVDITASATEEGTGLVGWQIALIVVSIVLAFFIALIALYLAVKKKNVAADADGFYDTYDGEE